MSEQLVAGLDVDTQQADGGQGLLATGHLTAKGLEIHQLKTFPCRSLSQELSAVHLAGVGLNFPFSVPVEFMDFCAQKARRPNFQSWQEYVEHLFSIESGEFLSLAKQFKQEPLRITDKQHKLMATSPLHKENPPTIDLTYQGMRNLAALDPAKFSILPFHELASGLCTVLEVCPVSTLAALRLSNTRSSYADKSAADQREGRRAVLESMLELKETRKLSCKDHPQLLVSPDIKSAIAQSDHALDAVVACYTAALYVLAPLLFEDPYESNNEDVLLEGWAYVPHGA